jgi:flagellar L-ring protein FlgH
MEIRLSSFLSQVDGFVSVWSKLEYGCPRRFVQSLTTLAASILCVLMSLSIASSTGYAQSGSLFRNPSNTPDFRGVFASQAEQLPAPAKQTDPSFPVLPPNGAPWDPNSNLLAASWTAQPPIPARNLRIHDIVAIRVDETATTNAQGNAQSRKTTLYDARLNDWLELVGWDTVKPAKQPDGDPRAQGQQNEVYRGSSSLQTREQVTFNIAAEIADIRPNGTLVLSAKKTIEDNDNTWLVSLSGVCRPQDVGPDNVILSRNIFDLAVRKQELGHVRDGYSRGWFTRWLARFKPF